MIFGNGTGAIRLVAIETALQRQGNGRVLSELVEDYAIKLGITQLYVKAAPEAIGYYEKLGWKAELWNQTELFGIASECSQMTKVLTE
jgi:N-acetylglutamate synthase-like GNAT family acetyltransferase